MTTKQRNLYFCQAKEAYEAWRECGHTGSSNDFRAKMHLKAIGRACSSTQLNNEELDLVLAAFYVWSKPADLNAQLRQQDQPEARANWLMHHLVGEIKPDLAELHPDDEREGETSISTQNEVRYKGRCGYISAILRSITGDGYLPHISLSDAYRVVSKLAIAANRRKKRARKPKQQELSDNPF